MSESPMPTNEAALPYKQKNYNQGTLLAVDMHRQYSDGKVSMLVGKWYTQTRESTVNVSLQNGRYFFRISQASTKGTWSGIHARQGKAPSSPCVSRALEAGQGKRWRTGKGKRGTFSISSWRKKEEEQPDLRIDDWRWTEY